MKLFSSLFSSFGLSNRDFLKFSSLISALASSDFWVNSYDDSARIPCGDLSSLENIQQLSWIKKNKAGSVEIAELIKNDENGEIEDDEKVAGFRIDDSGALVISKSEVEEFSLEDVGNYICRANLKTAEGHFEAQDSTTKLLVNFIIDKDNLEPVVRGLKLKKNILQKSNFR